MTKMTKTISKILAVLLFCGCTSHTNIQPQLSYTIQKKNIKNLSPPFTALNYNEREKDWGKEYVIGSKFLKDLNFYQSLTSFKRAKFLAEECSQERRWEMDYYLVLNYFMGEKYQEVINSFKESSLASATQKFTALHDLLVILHHSYTQINDTAKASEMLNILKEYHPKTAENMVFSHLISTGNVKKLKTLCFNSSPSQSNSPMGFLIEKANQDEDLKEIITHYDKHAKSPLIASTLNAILPGSGYLYLGQKQSALTALLLNGLFTYQAIAFYNKGQTAAALITASFESGWYFGGIIGAKEGAILYNERLYETSADTYIEKNKLYPFLMFEYGF